MLSVKRVSLIRNGICCEIFDCVASKIPTEIIYHKPTNSRIFKREKSSIRQCYFTTNTHGYSQTNAGNETRSFDPYQILGIESGASLKDVKEAYIRLSRVYHPDFNTGDKHSETKFILITEAYRKITEKLAAESETHEEDGRKEKKLYDFTIAPLGVETEPMEERKFINWKKLLLFAVGIWLTYYIKANCLSDMKYFMQDFFWPEPSEYEYMKATKDKIRKTLLKEASEQREKDKLLRSAKEAMYGARKEN